MFSTVSNASPRKRPLWCSGSVEVTSWRDDAHFGVKPSGDSGITKAALEQLRSDVVTDLTSPRPQSRPIGAHDELKILGRKVHQLSSFVMDIVKMLEVKIDTNDKKCMGSLEQIQAELRNHGILSGSSLQGKSGVTLPKIPDAAPPEQKPMKPVPPPAPKVPEPPAESKKNPRQAGKAKEPESSAPPECNPQNDDNEDEGELEVFLEPRQSLAFVQNDLETFRNTMEKVQEVAKEESAPESKGKGVTENPEEEEGELMTFVDPRQSMQFNGEDIDALVETLTGGEDLDTFLEPTKELEFLPPDELKECVAQVKRQSQMNRPSILRDQLQQQLGGMNLGAVQEKS